MSKYVYFFSAIVIFCRSSMSLPNQALTVETLHITSNIAFRYASTNVTSELVNNLGVPVETTYRVTLPPSAFISRFYMYIDGVLYEGEVKEKEATQKQYNKAKRKGQSAGQVASKSFKESNKFKIKVNIAALGAVKFTLVYDELLRRRLGLYEHVINIDPGQPVRDLKVKVNIIESRPITVLTVPELRSLNENIVYPDENPLVVITRPRAQEAIISFQPTYTQQRQYSIDGISGQFVVYYDVRRDLDGGEIQVVDGYFVHYFAPARLTPVDKNIVFVLDTSGSMSGDKWKQTKEAMNTILDDLSPGDAFNILVFSSEVQDWKQLGMVQANGENVQTAKAFIGALTARGGTNLNEGLLRGVEHLRRQAATDMEPRPALLICLTDGQPSTGVTNTMDITTNIKQSNVEGNSVFMLGFGKDVDFPFLRRISLQNGGLARRIYTDGDPTLQLEEFYEEVSRPVMSNVKVRYLDDAVEVDSVTTTDYHNLFNGTEIIIAGKLAGETVNSVRSQVSGYASNGFMEIMMEANLARVENRLRNLDLTHLTERLWAYLTIQKLLETMQATTDESAIASAKAKALEMSLKYQFVTPVTSMVVTKPDEDGKVTEDGGELADDVQRENSKPSRTQGSSLPPGRRSSFVDNDPHFAVSVAGIEEYICFDVNGNPGQIFQLLRDPINDIVVNAQIDAPPMINQYLKHTPTYITKIAVLHKYINVLVLPRAISLQGELIQWKTGYNFETQDLKIFFPSSTQLHIWIGDSIKLVIIRHLMRIPTPRKTNFLGFYIESGDGLSTHSSGLIGQFEHVKATFVNTTSMTEKAFTRTLQIRDTRPENEIIEQSVKTIQVHYGHRRNMHLKEHIPCWFAKNNAKGFSGDVRNYIVSTLTEPLANAELLYT